MTDEKLIAHAQRLHTLACGQGAARHDLIQLRDIVPRLLERLRDHAIVPHVDNLAVETDDISDIYKPGAINLSVVC